MKYRELIRETNEEMKERLELVMERVKEISINPETKAPYDAYYRQVAAYLTLLYSVYEKACSGELSHISERDGKACNEALFAEIQKDNYKTSFANPAYAVRILGEEYGQILSAVYASVRNTAAYVFEGNCQYLCIYAELFVELHTYFENPDELTREEIRQAVYSFEHDYSEVFNEDSVKRLVDPDYDYYTDIVMNSDLTDLSYLYRYGRYISANETGIAAFLNTLPQEDIQAMADTYTEGYRIGFEVTRKDLSIKETVEIRYPVGFERMVRCAVDNFAKMHLRPVMKPFSTEANKQYVYDHREDQALYLDKALVERGLEVYRTVFEKVKKKAALYAGPAVIEVFGEEPFSPETKLEAPHFSENQQQLQVYRQSGYSQIINQYIKGEERSFTIISYPVPEIGDQFPEIFAETVKINTLDYMLYRNMQQKIIDVLDRADYVHIVGAEGNKTDLVVTTYPLTDPGTQTSFENCVADVNIPVGEVFTSPVLKGTTGRLHVSQVYLNGLSYENLEIDFKDGMIEHYTCTNFADEKENQKYIRDNILHHHDTLPMGEFAIGTNTVAYVMARKYHIADKLPILIAEKTGPHFAVGDTCYTYCEDTAVYNPDGKEIVARDNEISLLRKEDPSKAYFNCHTDITIPYDELDKITAIGKDGIKTDIISGGRFVVPGTETLNVPLDHE